MMAVGMLLPTTKRKFLLLFQVLDLGLYGKIFSHSLIGYQQDV